MSERGNPTQSSTRDLPVIPDGGLGSSMPEWLRRPPAWKQSTDAPQTQHIPEPDTSPIDPATFLEIDDLPAWLQAVARRADAKILADQAETVAPMARGLIEPTPEPVKTMTSQPKVAPQVDATPAAVPAASLSPSVEHTSASPVPLPSSNRETSWWMSEKVFGALMLAVLLVLIYVILVATEVI